MFLKKAKCLCHILGLIDDCLLTGLYCSQMLKSGDLELATMSSNGVRGSMHTFDYIQSMTYEESNID